VRGHLPAQLAIAGRDSVRHLHHVFGIDAHGLVTNDNAARRRAAQDLRGLEHEYQIQPPLTERELGTPGLTSVHLHALLAPAAA
jgi:hypothetical protein